MKIIISDVCYEVPEGVANLLHVVSVERDQACDDNTMLRDELSHMTNEIARLAKERDLAREKWKSAIARYPNGANGCCCLFDNDQNQILWCSPHAKLRNELSRLTAALNDNERAEKVVEKDSSSYSRWNRRREAINDYRAMLKEATYV